jgi:hypothetical protein
MSVLSAKARLRELLQHQETVTTKEFETDIVLAGESEDELRLAVYELEDEGAVFVLRETHDAPSRFEFTGVQRLNP